MSAAGWQGNIPPQGVEQDVLCPAAFCYFALMYNSIVTTNEAEYAKLAMQPMWNEIMMKINEAMNFETQTGELTIRFLQPAFVNEPLHLRGWFVKKNKKVIENRAEIENEIGKIVARGKGKYIEAEE